MMSTMPLLTTVSVQYCLVISDTGGPPPPRAITGSALAAPSASLSGQTRGKLATPQGAQPAVAE
jgi:hypothetical protein